MEKLPLLEIMRPSSAFTSTASIDHGRFPEWMSQDKRDWIVSAAAHWRVAGPYDDKFAAHLRDLDWFETDSGWKHPDLGEEVYTLNQAYAYEREQAEGR